MYVYLKTFSGKKLRVKVRPGQTLADLKDSVIDRDPVLYGDYRARCVHNGSMLDCWTPLDEQGVVDGAVLHVILFA